MSRAQRAGMPAALLVAAIFALSDCVVLERAGRPVTRPAGDEGMLVYVVGRLAFSAPAAWAASGDETRVRLSSPAGDAFIEASAVQRPFAGEVECLADAEAVLARGAAGLANPRRHPTTFAGRRGITQEADQGPWHGWAWAICDAGVQYRVWFSGISPMQPEALEVQRMLVASAQVEGP